MTEATTYWASLSPNVQRALAWGAGIALLLGVAALAVKTAEPRRAAPTRADPRPDRRRSWSATC
jgi:hypothetical protein